MFTHQEELISKISDGQLQDFIYKQKDVLLLPIEVECGNLVFTELFKRWDKFVKLISETEWLQDSLPIVRKSMQYIKRAIKCYYALDIVASNNAMRNLLKVIQNTSFVSELDKLYCDTESSLWYRARVGDFNSYTKDDLNHIPFDKRKKITNQRYSINGIPCLYLGGSVLSCWEEMNRPSSDSLWVNWYRPKYPTATKILNLGMTAYMISHPEYRSTANFRREQIIHEFFELWILQSACSVIVKETDRIFIEEYIVPQLLMQNISHIGIDGVQYFSVKMHDAYFERYGWLSRNLAFPAKATMKGEKHSKEIDEMFTSSIPVNIGMLNQGFIPVATTDLTFGSINLARTHAIIPITQGLSYKYSDTIFYKIEQELIKGKYTSI